MDAQHAAAQDELQPAHLRHNLVAFMVDFVLFGVAISFVNPNTVMPAFVRTLTDSEPLIGLINSVLSATWLLPQLGVAAVITGKPRKKPYLIAAMFTGRPLYFLLGLAIWSGLARYPAAMLVAFFVCIGLFQMLDGMSAVPWYDMLARAVPITRRGRLLGTGQVIGGVLGIGVGALVSLILSAPQLPYPANFALLFVLSSLTLFPAAVALSLVREPEAPGAAEPHQAAAGLGEQLRQVWARDRNFRRLVASQWLVGLLSLALPFYVLHATDVVKLPEAALGWFVSAQMVGGIIAGVGLGWLTERKGPRPAIWLGALMALLSPLLALASHFAPGSLLAQAYPLIYLLIGATNSSRMLGALNYVLESAPKERISLYVSLYNTLAGVLVPASFLGGVLLQATSYPILFGVTAAGVAAGLWLSLGLDVPHRAEPADR
jgi:MFS family permease